MSEIILEGVSKRFGRRQAIADLNLTVRDAEFLVLLGPTGAGKTTTLRLVAGLEAPDAGRLRMEGRARLRAGFPRTRSAPASPRSPGSCTSRTSSRTAPRGSPAARCSASPSDARWCGGRRSSSWTSRFRRWTPSCARRCAWS
ncbi:MAG: ABC transporter ATP-binding protein [Deltaproteobacteria bacterium]|nr:MAG: ABC transporter ATP-binding protein [Deltaproteobacteria bacterium]